MAEPAGSVKNLVHQSSYPYQVIILIPEISINIYVCSSKCQLSTQLLLPFPWHAVTSFLAIFCFVLFVFELWSFDNVSTVQCVSRPAASCETCMTCYLWYNGAVIKVSENIPRLSLNLWANKSQPSLPWIYPPSTPWSLLPHHLCLIFSYTHTHTLCQKPGDDHLHQCGAFSLNLTWIQTKQTQSFACIHLTLNGALHVYQEIME